MPSVQQLADLVALTRSEFERNRWTTLASLYPDYLWVQQALQSRRMTKQTSTHLEWALEIAAPSSFEASYANHPLQVSVPDIAKKCRADLIKYRTSVGWTVDEQELQGGDETKLVSVIEMRMVKHERDYIEGLENALADKPTNSTEFPQKLFGLPYWLPTDTSATTLSMNGGADPAGFTGGAGGITVADVPRWAHAVAGWDKLSDDDLFDKLSEFLNRAHYFSPVPVPNIAPDVPQRQILIQMPLRLAYEKLLTVGNDNLQQDAGRFRNSLNFRSIPLDVWHAISDPASPVRPATGLLYVIDWNTFEWVFHSAFDGTVSNPKEDPHVPGAIRQDRQVYTQLKCVNRERNATFYSNATEFLPTAS